MQLLRSGHPSDSNCTKLPKTFHLLNKQTSKHTHLPHIILCRCFKIRLQQFWFPLFSQNGQCRSLNPITFHIENDHKWRFHCSVMCSVTWPMSSTQNNMTNPLVIRVLNVTTVKPSMEFGDKFVVTYTPQVHLKTAGLASTTPFSICCSSPSVYE
jgi:hypothetical protein